MKPYVPWYRGLNASVLAGRRHGGYRTQSLRNFAHAMAHAKLSDDELGVFLEMRLEIARCAQSRRQFWLGRAYNALSGESSDYLRLTGREVCDIL
ncbi:hypothetical protein [Shimia sp. NS0008-38b]|uniref:hypothetical protein n=1 Tax=Shimia sp. NS0008-38b TaxID=3127653 RepID=UPI0033429EBE